MKNGRKNKSAFTHHIKITGGRRRTCIEYPCCVRLIGKSLWRGKGEWPCTGLFVCLYEFCTSSARGFFFIVLFLGMNDEHVEPSIFADLVEQPMPPDAADENAVGPCAPIVQLTPPLVILLPVDGEIEQGPEPPRKRARKISQVDDLKRTYMKK